MKQSISIIVFCCLLFSAVTKKKTSDMQNLHLNTYSFEQVDSLQKIEKRQVVVFLHTEWCKYCLMMNKRTLSEGSIVKQLNERFYFVYFDAESRNDVHYLGRTFKFKATGNNTGVHELAEKLGTIKGQLNYPSICVLKNGNEMVFQHGGFLSSKSLNAVLKKLK